MALACGATVESAAQKAGISDRTAYRRLKDPEFLRKLADLKSDIVQRTSAMASAAGPEVVKKLLLLMSQSKTDYVQLGAARTMSDLGRKLRSETELEARIEALEAKIEAQSKDRPTDSGPNDGGKQ
jgi:hypothetical protein